MGKENQKTERTDRRGQINNLPEGMVTRNMILEKSGISVTEFNSFLGRGIFIAKGKTVRGWVYYDEREVLLQISEHKQKTVKPEVEQQRLPPASTDGSEPAFSYTRDEGLLVFKLLSAGKPLHEVFLESQIHPVILKNIFRDYETFSNCIFVMKDTLDEINKLSLDGPFPVTSSGEILELLKIASSASDATCKTCSKREPVLCHTCAKARFQPSGDGEAGSTDMKADKKAS